MNIKNKQEINERLIASGVNIIDSATTYIDESVEVHENVTIYPNCFIEGNSVLEQGCVIGANSKIVNSIIRTGAKIESSWIIDSEVGIKSTVGPMSHLRNGCIIGENCRIGNFVEMKNTLFKDGSKCAHLTYLGDCEVGSDVNIGCGVVTVNYDGKNKFKTIIGNKAFIGSNANLIAPINIGDYALVAAGSTCDKDVDNEAMAIARVRQVNKEGYGLKYLKK